MARRMKKDPTRMDIPKMSACIKMHRLWFKFSGSLFRVQGLFILEENSFLEVDSGHKTSVAVFEI